jgi:hypothetical protein
MNDRLAVQQGMFLCNNNLSLPFFTALERIPASKGNYEMYEIQNSRYILKRLHRTGITRAALFPGLQGFAESLRSKIVTYLDIQELRNTGSRFGPPTMGV